MSLLNFKCLYIKIICKSRKGEAWSTQGATLDTATAQLRRAPRKLRTPIIKSARFTRNPSLRVEAQWI